MHHLLTNAATAQHDLQLCLHDGIIASLMLNGRELATSAPSGFFIRDVLGDSPVCPVLPHPGVPADERTFRGTCPSLGLEVEAAVTGGPQMIRIEGRVIDTRHVDRAITLTFALPLNATGWHWGDDIRRARVIDPAVESCYQHTTEIAAGSTGTQTQYPLAAIYADEVGLALAVDMDKPALYRLAYDAGVGQLRVEYDFGLVPDSRHFPSSAPFAFILYAFDPAWGFRGAFQTLTDIFPAQFTVRATRQGLWMPFTDISTVDDWHDFGFQFHEGSSDTTLPFNASHGIDSFPYIEPMTWWQPLAPSLPRTLAATLTERDRLINDESDERLALRARVSTTAAMTDADGTPYLQFHDLPWCNGAVWSLNPNPYLADQPNAGTTLWNAEKRRQYFGEEVAPQMSGMYLDSLEGYVTAELNFCRAHFRETTVPLTFDQQTAQPALQKGLAIFEFTRYIAEDLHRLGKLVFANGVPYRFPYLCPLLDLLGTETDWMAEGQYAPADDRLLCLWRTMAGAKPYLLLMNTDFDAFTSDLVERYLQHSLFYGFYPSMFSANAAEHQYWQHPEWYNRDRHLFRQYIPIITRVASAGWQPVTGARSDNPQVWLERFGDVRTGDCYLTARNTGKTVATVRIDLTLLARDAVAVTVEELLTGAHIAAQGQQFTCTLPAEGVAVWQVRRSA